MHNKRILIIGQAPPAVKQGVPYDTTMLYDWLNELDISKEQAQELFDFDAVYDKFPGFDSKGGHLKPSNEQMEDYYARSLEDKINASKAVIVLGACARNFLNKKVIDKPCTYTIHPSKRNYYLYNKNKNSILAEIKKVL